MRDHHQTGRQIDRIIGFKVWILTLSLLLLASCATLPTAAERAEQTTPDPVLAKSGKLGDKQADAVIQAVAGASSTDERSTLKDLTDAIRSATDSTWMLGNRVTPLVDGPETFAHLRRYINEARSSVHVETYIFTDDALGKSFADLLIEKAQQGVEVRLIVDGLGSVATASSLFTAMSDGGVQVKEFRPLVSLRTLPWRYHNRDHRKVLIVDGKVAFTGGLNISGAYSSGSTVRPGPERGVKEAWRDTHAQLEGPVVRQFQAIFFETWVRLGGEAAADNAKYFPALPEVGTDIVTAVTSSGVRQRDEAIYSTYLAAVEHAAQSVWITQAYLAPPPELKAALVAAAQRGVDVRILVPGFTDSGPVFYAARANYDELLKGGVRLLEVNNALLHAKTAIFDRAVSVIGSANLDYRSFLHNNEVTAVIISESLGREMEVIFNKDAASAKEITLEQWRRRSAVQRFKESLSHLFNYWL